MQHNIEDPELVELEKEHIIESLARDIRFLITRTSGLLLNTSSYPPHVLNEIDELDRLQRSIKSPKNKPYFKSSLQFTHKDLFNDPDYELVDKECLSSWECLYKELETTGKINLEKFKASLLDKYFDNFVDYWESSVGELTRKHAIVNRRKYLVDKMQEFDTVLLSRGISKYHTIISDYREYNIMELQRLCKM